ncbi:poly-beta-1,6-N-acetyl-D-glucosamine N-deacetylase PgaB [Oceanisphaera profunda]|nr:poly-beta-1,6-N-acetyl-D-glucosamine N-deacetylase PgaB [Oceanisphaera profunda]
MLQVAAIVFALFSTIAFAQPVDFLPPQQRALLNMDKPWPKNHFLALGYHDVEDDVADERYLSVRTSALNDQMAWLFDNGYTAISVQQILDAHNGGKPLPNKAVLLSFDDGYSSFYTRVYPLLKAYNWPALWAPVGAWLDTPADQLVDFGGLPTERKRFANWEMVRALKDSPLVNIGAHTWDSHYGALGNPQGSKKPTIANRLYDPKLKAYESEAAFHDRVEADVLKITQKITEVTDKSPIAWVWPYGAASGTTLSVLRKHGYDMAFTLQTGLANVEDLSSIPRILISGNPSIDAFARQVTRFEEQESARVMHVDLDYVYDSDPEQQRKNIDALIQRVYDMKASHVFLQAYADPQGDGTVKELYFPNRWLPMRADLFNFVSWQLHTRADVKIYAWMPVLAFDLDKQIPRVQSWSAKGVSSEQAQYQRLSPWNPVARQQITEIYEDLAGHAAFHGILFHDDALLSDFEDAGSDALAAYKAAGFGNDIASIRRNPKQLQAWSRYKSQFLIDFTKDLTQAVRDIRGPQVKTARNIYAMPILEPKSEQWFAQNLNDFMQTYNWTAVMAMPLMEEVPLKQSNAWLKKLVKTSLAQQGAQNKVLFELQTLDWRKNGGHLPIPSSQLAEWMYQLQMNGARHFGYYPDDFLSNQPDLKTIRPAFSSYWYPNYE